MAVSTWVIVVAAVVIIVGFGISEVVIWKGVDFHALPENEVCPTIDVASLPGNQFVFRKDIWSQWHWSYTLATTGYTGRVFQRCPSVRHDAELVINGKVAGRTDGKIATLQSKTNVLDCHGNRTFISETGSAWQTFINSNNILVQYLIYADNGTTLAYVQGTHFVIDDIEILDYQSGNRIAKLYRDKLTVHAWTWTITVDMPNHPVADPVLLTLIAAQRSFSEDPKANDICNNYFKDVGIMLVVLMVVTFLGVCFAIYSFCRR